MKIGRKKALVCFSCVLIVGVHMCTSANEKTLPIGWWNFEDVSGNTVPDVSGNGHDGIAKNARWVTGKFGTALHIRENKGLVEIPDSPAFRLTKEVSLEAWVCPFRLAIAPKIVGRPGKSDYHGYWIDAYGSPKRRFRMFAGGGTRETSKSVFADLRIDIEDWYHVVGTFKNGVIRIYVNGNLEGEAKGPEVISLQPGYNLFIGVHK